MVSKTRLSGVNTFLCSNVRVLHDTNTTGLGNYDNIPLNPFLYFSLLFNIRSPRHLRSRFYFHLLTIPLYFVPAALLLIFLSL